MTPPRPLPVPAARLRRAALLVGAVLLAAAAGSPPARAEDGDSFVVQEVCVDGAGAGVPGDPATCQAKRKLRIGEAIPTRRADAGNWQALYSYPVAGLGGERRAMAAKVFGGADTSGAFRDLGARSGYDLIEEGRAYVSIIRTSDQGGGDQIFWRTTGCQRADGWILFPPGLRPGERGETRSTLKITPGPSTACPFMWRIGPDFTTWERPTAPYRYTSGKSLDTIQSLHFAYGEPADPSHTNDSMEKFYFTREYGFSRWEAWETPVGCLARAAKTGRNPQEACRPSPTDICNGPNTATFYGKLYWRLDCRDSTFTAKAAEAPFNPLTNSAAPGDVLNRNLLANGTFFDGAAGWENGGAVTAGPIHEPATNNSALRLSGGAGTLAQAFAVPKAMDGPGRVLRWGASVAAAAPTTLVLTLQPAGSAPIVVSEALPPAGALHPATFEVPLPPSGGQDIAGRLELRLPGGEATVDDAFAAVVEAGGGR